MIIKCDEKGKNAILSMCDVCLKTGGMANRDVVNTVFDCLQDVDQKPKEKGKKEKDKKE